MADAGINISITGDSGGFEDAAAQAAKTAESTAREIADTSKRQAEADRRAYDEAMSDLRRRTQARIAAAKDVQRAEAAAAKAATEANSRNTAESRAAAQAKTAEAAAARRAADAAVTQQKVAADTARATRQAMRESATEASRTADAHLRAAQNLARSQAAGRRGSGGGGLPGLPGGGSGGGGGGGGGGGSGPGGGGVGGAVGRILSGAARGGGGAGGGGGGGSAIEGTSQVTEVIESIISGGAVEVLKEGPKIAQLVRTYGATVARMTGVAAAVVGTGVAIGRAVGDWDGFVENLRWVGDKLQKFGHAIANPRESIESLVNWMSDSDVIEEQAKKMDEAFKKYQSKRLLVTARDQGTEQGKTAEQVGKDQQKGVESRAEAVQRLIAEREQAVELQKIQLGTMQDQDEHARRLAEIEKAWVLEKAAIQKSAAEAEFDLAQKGYDSAKAVFDELNAAAKKARLAPGASGSSEALEDIEGKRSGVEGRFNTAQAILDSAAKALRQADDGGKAAGAAGQIIDQGLANTEAARAAEKAKAEADRAAEQARQSSSLHVKQFWQKIEDATRQGIENAKLAAAQAISKQDADKELAELQLRARGGNRAADKMRKEREIQKEAGEYQAKDPQHISDAQARAFAERKYDATHSNGRIRGAGRKSGTEPVPAFGIDNPGFAPGGLGVQPSGPGSFPGLDGLDEMQKRNRRIRGAGDKYRGEVIDALGTLHRRIRGAGARPDNDYGGGSEPPVTTSSPTGAVAGVIISQLTAISKKLDYLSPAKQTRRN